MTLCPILSSPPRIAAKKSRLGASGLIFLRPSAVSSANSMNGQSQTFECAGKCLLNHSEGVVGFRSVARSPNIQGSGSHFLSCNLAVLIWSWIISGVADTIAESPLRLLLGLTAGVDLDCLYRPTSAVIVLILPHLGYRFLSEFEAAGRIGRLYKGHRLLITDLLKVNEHQISFTRS